MPNCMVLGHSVTKKIWHFCLRILLLPPLWVSCIDIKYNLCCNMDYEIISLPLLFKSRSDSSIEHRRKIKKQYLFYNISLDRNTFVYITAKNFVFKLVINV